MFRRIFGTDSKPLSKGERAQVWSDGRGNDSAWNAHAAGKCGGSERGCQYCSAEWRGGGGSVPWPKGK